MAFVGAPAMHTLPTRIVEFSLVRGGPFHRLLVAGRLVGDGGQVGAVAAATLGLFASVPFALLTLLQWGVHGRVTPLFVTHRCTRVCSSASPC